MRRLTVVLGVLAVWSGCPPAPAAATPPFDVPGRQVSEAAADVDDRPGAGGPRRAAVRERHPALRRLRGLVRRAQGQAVDRADRRAVRPRRERRHARRGDGRAATTAYWVRTTCCRRQTDTLAIEEVEPMLADEEWDRRRRRLRRRPAAARRRWQLGVVVHRSGGLRARRRRADRAGLRRRRVPGFAVARRGGRRSAATGDSGWRRRIPTPGDRPSSSRAGRATRCSRSTRR